MNFNIIDYNVTEDIKDKYNSLSADDKAAIVKRFKFGNEDLEDAVVSVYDDRQVKQKEAEALKEGEKEGKTQCPIDQEDCEACGS